MKKLTFLLTSVQDFWFHFLSNIHLYLDMAAVLTPRTARQTSPSLLGQLTGQTWSQGDKWVSKVE